MRLPHNWENFLEESLNLCSFYKKLDKMLDEADFLTPRPELIFNVFKLVAPQYVRCVLFGEDPYPRITSANGIAFWDAEIQSWHDKTNGNSLKNILKALLVADGLANYRTSIAECREIAENQNIKSPPKLFELWLGQGVLLVNTSLAFSGSLAKKKHFEFWQPFHKALIHALNKREQSPFYILWGAKATQWENVILKTIDDPQKIIKQSHPTFIHHFLAKNDPHYSPFTEIIEKTGLQWY